MKLTIALLVAAVGLLAAGGEALYLAIANRQQVALSCDQLGTERPQAAWLALLGCQLGDDVRYQESGGEFTELLLPVRRARQPVSEPALMVAATRNPEVLAIVHGVLGGGQQVTEEGRTVMMLRILTALDASQRIQGTTRRGLLHAFSTRRTLGAANGGLVPGAPVLDLNERPPIVWPAVLTAAGGALLFFAAARLLRRTQTAQAVADANAEPAQPGADASVETARPAALTTEEADERPIRGLLLLNLDASAGRDAIEQAPPLGPRAEVEQTIARAMTGLTFDSQGRGAVTSGEGWFEIQLDPGPVAWTAVVQAQGRSGRQLVRTLVENTGWRIYYPKGGAFLNPDEVELL